MSNTSINETYIIEGIGEVLEFSACTAIFSNALKSCSGNTTIDLGENLIVFNGNTLATIISATTYYGDGSNLTGISTQDTYVTGGTYSLGTAVFTNNTGGTFSVTGFYTGTTIPFDVFVTGGTYSDGTAEFTNNTGGTFTVTGLTTPFTGGTVNGSTIFTDGLTATTFSASTYLGLPITSDIYVTGGTYSDGTAEFTNNSGDTFNVTGFTTPFTGGTVQGPTIFTDGLTANTFSLSTTPSTNTTDTDVLLRNQSTGIIEQRSINSLINVVNLVTVGLSGSVGVDYYSIQEAVDSIVNASATNTYVVKVGPGVFYEDPITMKSYVDVIGESETNTIIQANNPNTSLIIGADQSMVSEVQIQGCTGTGVAAVIYSSPTTPQLNAIFYVENVRFGANYTHAKTVGTSGGNCIMQCSNVKYGGYPFTLGFYVTNDGSGIGRMQLRNVTSTNGGVTTTSGLIFAKADQPSCAFIVNGCLLTKASGAAAGTGFWVENGGSLRLTGVNFQRWATGIYAPQTGSAPSIEAIALNFENCTTDVNIIHSGATGKVQGTDNYVKTLINIDAPLYEVNNDPRVITVAKKGGDFSSIKSAVDSITNSSINNRFLVSVGPGRFSEGEIDLTGKPYVSVEGSNIITTEIVPSTNNQHIFKIGQNNEISFLSLSGAPVGYAGIYVYDIGDYAQAHKISFTDCDTNVWVESDTQDTIFFGEYLDFNGSYSYGTKIIARNGYVASANIENYYNFPTGTGTTIGNHVQGSGATLSVFIGDGIGNGGVDSANYQILDYASLNTISTTAYNWDYGIRVLNIGGPSRFDIDSYSVVDSLVWDLSVEHPNTFGTFGGGSASHAKINNESNDVYWAFLDIGDGEFDITRKISITFDKDTHTDASTLIFEGSTMGLMDGGLITHVSGLTFEVSLGFGYLKKTVGNGIYMRVDWPVTQITLLPNSENYLYFNENEILSSSGSAPDNVNNIILGKVVTDSSTVRFIDSSPYIASHTSNLFSDFNRSALGPIYSTGSIVTENTTPYHLNISSGDYYYSENNFKPSGGTDVSFVQYYRDGSSGWITTGTTEVVNGYDDNSGTISPLPLSSFTKHSLYVVGQGINEQYMLVLGQTYYNSLVEAEGADLPTPPNYFDDAVTTIANILIQQGVSGITQIQDIRPVIGFKAAGISATAVHGNLLGLNSDDHKQYLLVDGSRAMTNNLSMGGNAIVSALTVNGVTVESHASRHKNGGADEISTAIPAPSEIPKSDTFGKLDGWISDASSSVKGLTRLSQAPASATVPIAVGVNDPRFLNSISGVTNITPSLVFTNNSGGTTTISNLIISSVSATTISATTISATTYNNLPLDIRVTGATKSGTVATFTNNSGSTFTLTGLTDTFVTGATYSNNTFTYRNNTGGTFNVFFNTMTGLTATTISATTYQNLPTDIRVTGGTYNSGLGQTTFTNNTGGTFSINGYFKPVDDIRVTGGTYSYTAGTATYMNNTGGTFSVTGFSKNLWYAENATPPTTAPTATGTGSIVFGDNASSSGNYSFVYGNNAQSQGTDSNVLGRDAGTYANNVNFFGQNAGNGAAFSHNSNFMGAYAGAEAYSSSASNFFGYYVGFQSVYSVNDNFIGNYAGFQSSNVTNSNFIGEYAGFQSPYVNFSNFIGHHAGLQSPNINNSNFIGESAGKTATNANYSNFIGSYAGNQAIGAIYSNFLGDNAGQASYDGYSSNFIGQQAGKGSTNANNSNFFGYGAGESSYYSYESNFMGNNSGQGAFGSNYSNFFGNNAGQGAYVSNYSNFFGERAGKASQYSNNSNFLGQGAGQTAVNAYSSNFMGANAGLNTSGAYQSNFFGQNAGESTSAYNSNFIGFYAGNFATNAYQSTFIGAGAGQNANAANDSTFIGYQAGQNAPSAHDSVFIGNSAGYEATYAYQSNFIGNYAGYQATYADNSNFMGIGAGQNAIYAHDSNFMGKNAGNGVYAGNSNFLGNNAGNGATSANYSNFLGESAGYQATNASYSNFLGNNAGNVAYNATQSNFIGSYAGINATNANNSNFIGNNTGYYAINANDSNFLGSGAGQNATDASLSNFIGNSAGNQATNASSSNFLGAYAGNQATNANDSNFFGYQAGQAATAASYSNLLGYSVGKVFPTDAPPFSNNIGANNIIIGTNISLPNGASNSINLGGVLFGTGTYSEITSNPSITGQTNGRIGINVVNPTEALDVFGNTNISGKVGIGTTVTAPYLYGFASNLAIGMNTGSTGAVLDLRNTSTTISAGDTTGTIQFSAPYSSEFYTTSQIKSTNTQAPSGGASGGGNIAILTSRGGTGEGLIERMRVTNLGNVLIGTTSGFDTTSKLQVSGTVISTTISATTYLNLPSTGGSTFTGGTVSGATNFTNGLTANTFSATTYLNLPATSQAFISVSVDTVLTNDNQTVIVNSTSPITITLPQITGDGRAITIKNINTGVETILPYSGQLIDGDPSVIVARKNVSLDFQSYNNNWYLI